MTDDLADITFPDLADVTIPKLPDVLPMPDFELPDLSELQAELDAQMAALAGVTFPDLGDLGDVAGHVHRHSDQLGTAGGRRGR